MQLAVIYRSEYFIFFGLNNIYLLVEYIHVHIYKVCTNYNCGPEALPVSARSFYFLHSSKTRQCTAYVSSFVMQKAMCQLSGVT